ncbi:MAG: crossover junction endodeoxyribonuclease RuvC [bacterium]|nr:crossover junction endodeoxyribonuclease RuvC [bacterium]MDZ4231660.1 crossover junction endodeoxyribonuclease RuvC [Candidatus Pacearchaeota archaeon]
MIILGIDPGTATTGFGVIKVEKGLAPVCLAYDCILTDKGDSPAERLLSLQEGLLYVMKKHKPHVAGVEKLYFSKNVKTGMAVSEARGVILLSTARFKLPVHEFTPSQVKMAVTGNGAASKIQVQRMVKEILQLEEIPKPDDAADALACAIACSLHLKVH